MSIIDSDWIVDFDQNQPFNPLGYGIEWRQPPIPRTGQWHVYHGKILEVSDDMDILKDREREEKQKLNERTPQRPQPSNPSVAASNPGPSGASNPGPSGASSVSTPESNGGLLHLLKQLVISQGQGQAAVASTSPSIQDDQVKVGKTLSIPKSLWLEAKATRSPTAMTMVLVRSSFSRRRLIRSSYAGQKRKRGDKVQRKPGLKKYQCMRDIQDFVRSRFPNITQSTFGAAVNSCTGNKAEKRVEPEYME